MSGSVGLPLPDEFAALNQLSDPDDGATDHFGRSGRRHGALDLRFFCHNPMVFEVKMIFNSFSVDELLSLG